VYFVQLEAGVYGMFMMTESCQCLCTFSCAITVTDIIFGSSEDDTEKTKDEKTMYNSP
jgi:hypothetical protein